jgi:hypothetical protein
MLGVAAVAIGTPALSQGLNKRTDLVSPTSGRADPGDLVMAINETEALPNAFGMADIFGRRRPAGRTVVQYLGTENGIVYFNRQSTSVSSNETTMTRTPLLIPRNTQTTIDGQIGSRTFSGRATTTETTVVGPRPHTESQIALAPVRIGVKVGESVRAAGHELRVLKIYSNGSIDYAAK